MYVYIQSEPGLFTVGFYDLIEGSTGGFNPESDHTTREAAAARVNYLNGGADLSDLRGVVRQINGLAEQVHACAEQLEFIGKVFRRYMIWRELH